MVQGISSKELQLAVQEVIYGCCLVVDCAKRSDPSIALRVLAVDAQVAQGRLGK